MSDVVETIQPDGSVYKVDIVRRPDGLLQVFLFKWVEEIVPGERKVAEFWAQRPTAASITDDLNIARSIGRELLVAADPSFAAPDR